MNRKLTTLLIAFVCALAATAQPLDGKLIVRGNHHTQRLPGVNERRMERLEKMRQENIALRQRKGPYRANGKADAKKGLVLLVEFSDAAGKMKDDASTQWYNRFNQQGFSQFNHVGSVRDYFIEQSYGMLTIDFDVVGPITMPQTREYYGSSPNSNLDDRAPEMIIEALKLADSELNYADYDWDGNGEVEQIYVIFAGRTYSDTPGYIWPHQWYLSSAKYFGCGAGRQRLDGVYIDAYAVSQELADASTPMGIGTACHEFSHCLGYPDVYDTSYSGGTAGQYWDVLDTGSYNGPRLIGEVPSPYTAYERWAGGWMDLIPLTEPCRVIDMPALNEEGVAYIIKNTGNSNEYYILENRQQKTFGTYNIGHGLMVWHIDYNKTAWANNTVNTNKNHQRITFLPADGQVGVLQGSGGYYQYYVSSADESGDPYPGRTKVDSVQQLTWYKSESGGDRTHKNRIHSITESADGKISFTYGNYVPLAAPEANNPTEITESTFRANWLPVPGAISYNLQVEEEDVKTILTEDFANFESVSNGTQITDMDSYTQTQGWAASSAFGTGKPYVRLATPMKAGSITTPSLTASEGTLIVEFDASYYATEAGNVTVSVLKDDVTIASESVQMKADRATYTCTFEGLPSGCRVSFKAERQKRAYIYNVKIMNKWSAKYEGLTTTSHLVEHSCANMYYYRVQAACAEGTSEWSDWMSVDIASPVDAIAGDKTSGTKNADAYDLSGRRLNHVPQKGLFIRSGKVYMNR